jgi:GTPase KRas protein
LQFLQYQYPVEDRLRKTLQTPYIIDNECALIHIDVIDPKWEGEHLPILERTLRAGHGFMLVYSVESRVSLLSLWTLQQEIFRVTEKDKLPMVLVGVHRKNRRRREVTLQEGTDVAGLIGCPFYEVSHETEHNLENAYYDIVREIRADDKRQSAADGHREAAQWARVNKLRQLQIVDVDAFTG